MGDSYTIYLKNKTDGGSGGHSPTKAWQPGTTNANTSTLKFTDTFKKVKGYKQNPMKEMMGDAALVKMGWVGIAILAVKKAVQFVAKVGDIIHPVISETTGNKMINLRWQNVKNSVSSMFHPIQYAGQYYKAQNDILLENTRLAQNQLLTGNSIINSGFTGYGV